MTYTRAVAWAAVLCITSTARGQDARVVVMPELRKHFDEFHATGTFVLLDAAHNITTIYNPARAAQGFLPASTFKIFNSLVALESGIVGLDDTLPWDGVDRGVAAWNQDQRMREAFQRSTVWYYQELARRAGEERLRQVMKRERYGNGDTGGGVDRFWLDGKLRISAQQQVDFLRRLHERRLGFPASAIEAVEELLVLERSATHTLRGKTGWTRWHGNQLGWLVGWVERDGRQYYYAMNLESPEPRFPMVAARPKIVRAILRELNVLP